MTTAKGIENRSCSDGVRYCWSHLGALVLGCLVVSGGVSAQEPETWTVGAEPLVSIGTLDGAEEDMLINVLMATVLSEGTIVLRNSARGTFEIRYYSPDGAHITTVSRFGQGPYEFRFPLGVFRLPGDSIFLAGEDDRFAVFGPCGERVREGRMGLVRTAPISYGLGLDSIHLVFLKYVGPAMPEPGTHRTAAGIFAYDLIQRAADSIGVALGKRTHYERMDGREGVHIYTAPFAPETSVAIGHGLVWIGDNEGPEIHGYRPGQTGPAVTVLSPFEPKAISRQDRARTRAAYSSRSSGDTQKRWARYARRMDFPDRMPWFGHLKVDRLGNLWVQEYEPFWAEGDQHWAVFSSDGYRVADVIVPADALPPCDRRVAFSCSHLSGVFEIGDDYMLVPQTDEWGVRYLRKYPLRKPS